MGRSVRLKRSNKHKKKPTNASADNVLFEAYELEFPVFTRIRNGMQSDNGLDRLQPSDMDSLGIEISKAFQRCSAPETTVSEQELQINHDMMFIYTLVDDALQKDSEKGPMLSLLRNIITTSQNLQALLSMIDVEIRTGLVRYVAMNNVWYLTSANAETWRIKLPDGVSFARRCCGVLAKFLHDETMNEGTRDLDFSNYRISCECIPYAMVTLSIALTIANEKIEIILQDIASYDWVAILQRRDLPLWKSDGAANSGSVLFSRLHSVSVRALEKDSENSVARELLRKLGSCRELIHGVLLRIISGELWAVTGTYNKAQRVLDAKGLVVEFFVCLLPQPRADGETATLVTKALASLQNVAIALLAANDASGLPASDTFVLRHLANRDIGFLQKLSENQHEDFWRIVCDRDDDGFDFSWMKGTWKQTRKINKGRIRRVLAEREGRQREMCANCFVLEKDTERGRLLVCSRCDQVRYCSAQCQKEHWYKAHKEQCRKCRETKVSL